MRQAELIRELELLGYDMTKRRLTDWRAKGLLPKLKQVGEGRGQGSTQIIECPETTIKQAIAVAEIYAKRWRTDTTLLGIWSIGFSVEPELIREAWLKRFDLYESRMEAKARKTGDISDLLSSIAGQAAKGATSQHGLPYEAVWNILTVLYGVFHGVQQPFDEFEFEDFSINLFSPKIEETIFKSWEIDGKEKEIISKNIIKCFQSLRLKKLKSIIENSSDAELRWIHKNWLKIIELVRTVWLTAQRSASPRFNTSQLEEPLKLAFALPMILVLISFAKFDKCARIDRTIELLVMEAMRFERDGLTTTPGGQTLPTEAPQNTSQQQDVWDELIACWEGFSETEFLQKIEKFRS